MLGGWDFEIPESVELLVPDQDWWEFTSPAHFYMVSTGNS